MKIYAETADSRGAATAAATEQLGNGEAGTRFRPDADVGDIRYRVQCDVADLPRMDASSPDASVSTHE